MENPLDFHFDFMILFKRELQIYPSTKMMINTRNILRDVGRCFSLRDSEIADLRLFLEGGSVNNPQNLISISRIYSVEKFDEAINEIINKLEELLSKEELDNLRDETKRLISGALIDLSLIQDYKGNNGQSGGQKIFIPVEEMIYFPKRSKADLIQIIWRIFGTPIQSVLKEDGLTEKCKKSKFERNYEFNHLLFYRVSPTLDKLLKLGKISETENKFIIDLVSLIQFARSRFIQSNKEVTKKDITSAISKMEATKLLSPKDANILEDTLLKKEIVIVRCKLCGEPFERTRRTQEYCSKHSNSAEYQRYRRKLKGAKPRGGKRPGAGRKKIK